MQHQPSSINFKFIKSSNMSDDKTAPSDSTIDPFKQLQIIQNDDGTITRNWTNFPSTVATPNIPDDHHHTLDVLSKDVPVNQSKDTWVRIFLPCQALDPSSTAQLPLIVHFHGGGFVVLSAATSLFHDFCSNIAAKVPAVVASVEYRLAPEHRLPAAYDDAMEVLHWIKKTQEDWLHKYVDLSCCFLMGDSSGGNIAYHAGLRASAQVDGLLPLKIRGLILNYPFFGGVKRTESELRLVNDAFLPLGVNDLMWELALPIGVDRDNEYCNPTVEGGSKLLDHIRMLGWNVMVSGSSEDPLIDRQIEFVKMMERKGVKVICHLDQGGKHGFDDSDPVTAAKRRAVLDCIKILFYLRPTIASERVSEDCCASALYCDVQLIPRFCGVYNFSSVILIKKN